MVTLFSSISVYHNSGLCVEESCWNTGLWARTWVHDYPRHSRRLPAVSLTDLDYTDGIVLSNYVLQAQRQLEHVEEECSHIDLVFNVTKTKVLLCNKTSCASLFQSGAKPWRDTRLRVPWFVGELVWDRHQGQEGTSLESSKAMILSHCQICSALWTWGLDPNNCNEEILD